MGCDILCHKWKTWTTKTLVVLDIIWASHLSCPCVPFMSNSGWWVILFRTGNKYLKQTKVENWWYIKFMRDINILACMCIGKLVLKKLTKQSEMHKNRYMIHDTFTELYRVCHFIKSLNNRTSAKMEIYIILNSHNINILVSYWYQ